MSVKPDSRHAALPVYRVAGPDGLEREVIGLRLRRPELIEDARRHRLTRADSIDLLAKQFYGDERLWWRILDANPILFPLPAPSAESLSPEEDNTDIQVGQNLVIPAPGPSTQVRRAREF